MPASTQSPDIDDQPLVEGERILGELAARDPEHIFAAVSGGDDSTVALYFAAQSPHIDLDGILTIDTGIGVRETIDYVGEQADRLNLPHYVIGDYESRFEHERYEWLVKRFGFPGANPIAHSGMQKNLKSKPFNLFVNSFDGDVALISGVRKLESNRRYRKLTQLATNGILELDNILWASPIVEFSDEDLTTYKDHNDIPENMVSALLNSSGECLCAFEDRQQITTLKEFYPDVANKIYQLEWDVLEQVCRGEIPQEYALWAHGSLDPGEYEARTNEAQDSLLCADCENACGEPGYSIESGPALTPAEQWMSNNDLDELWQWPFYCAPCDEVITDPVTHRKDVHPFDETTGLEGYWDLRLIDLGASYGIDALVTEPNGYNLHINDLVPEVSQAVGRKHKEYYENFALWHCDDHDHDWELYNGGPVRQCTECFCFDISDYDPANPGPPILEPQQREKTARTPSEQKIREVHRTLDRFTDTPRTVTAPF